MGEAAYKKLLTYKYSAVIHYFTRTFTSTYLFGREHLRDREQMDQAGRSGVRCLAEGATQGTSLSGYLKMLGVTRGSFEELLGDFIDFAILRKIGIWEKGDRKFMGKRIFVNEDTPIPPYPPIPQNLEVFVNVMVDLITRTNYLLDQQKRSLEGKHMREGGFREKLLQKRLEYRRRGGAGGI